MSETKEERIARMEREGLIVKDCPQCLPFYEHPAADPFAPMHRSLPSCQSGSRPHCTCDSCF